MSDLERARISLERYKTNHVLHALLSFFTGGIWIIVWIILTALNTSKRNDIYREFALPEESNPVGCGCLLVILFCIVMYFWSGYIMSNVSNSSFIIESHSVTMDTPFL